MLIFESSVIGSRRDFIAFYGASKTLSKYGETTGLEFFDGVALECRCASAVLVVVWLHVDDLSCCRGTSAYQASCFGDDGTCLCTIAIRRGLRSPQATAKQLQLQLRWDIEDSESSSCPHISAYRTARARDAGTRPCTITIGSTLWSAQATAGSSAKHRRHRERTYISAPNPHAQIGLGGAAHRRTQRHYQFAAAPARCRSS